MNTLIGLLNLLIPMSTEASAGFPWSLNNQITEFGQNYVEERKKIFHMKFVLQN